MRAMIHSHTIEQHAHEPILRDSTPVAEFQQLQLKPHISADKISQKSALQLFCLVHLVAS